MSSRDLFALESQALQRSFKLFVRDAWQYVDGDDFIYGWHIDVICDHLQAVSEGRCPRLLVNMPPGFAKSTILSVLWPAWTWTFDPGHRFLSTSYSLELSQTHSRMMRQLVTSDWYQARWPLKLKDDQNEKTNFENEHGGTRKIRAFSSLTGARGDTVIVDDPHSMDAAWSEDKRKAAVQTFKASVPSRLHSRQHGRIVVVMQRFHEEDVSGYILEHPKLNYVHLCMRHEHEGSDKTPNGLGWIDPRKEEGELLFPAFMSREKVEEEKASLGPDWAGQHQQRPTPREAGVIDTSYFKKGRFDLKDKAGNQGWPQGCNYYMTSDHALGTTKGDYSVFRVWACDADKNLWLVDSFREVCEMQDAMGITSIDGRIAVADKGALALIRKWRPIAYFPEADNNYKAVAGFLQSAMEATGIWVDVKPVTPHGQNKVGKAQSYIGLARAGQIHLPNGPIGDRALEEYRAFPNGKKDDQVDADSMIGRVVDQLYAGFPDQTEEELEEEEGYGRREDWRTSSAETFFI